MLMSYEHEWLCKDKIRTSTLLACRMCCIWNALIFSYFLNQSRTVQYLLLIFRNAVSERHEKLLTKLVGPHRVESIYTAEHISQRARSRAESVASQSDDDDELELMQKTHTRHDSQELDGPPGSSRGTSAATFLTEPEPEAEENGTGAGSAQDKGKSPNSLSTSRQSHRSRPHSAVSGLTVTLPALEASVDLHSLRPSVAMMQRNSCLFLWRNKRTYEMNWLFSMCVISLIFFYSYTHN